MKVSYDTHHSIKLYVICSIVVLKYCFSAVTLNKYLNKNLMEKIEKKS